MNTTKIDPTAAYAFPEGSCPHILLNKTFQPPDCSCRVEGHGMLPSPVIIKFCPLHENADALRAERRHAGDYED